MNLRAIGLIAAAVAALSPSISNATPEHVALNACAKAFASSVASHGAAAPSYKVAYNDDLFAGTLAEFYPQIYTFELDGHDAKTGATVAHATCSADKRGAVVSLSTKPVGAARSLAARL